MIGVVVVKSWVLVLVLVLVLLPALAERDGVVAPGRRNPLAQRTTATKWKGQK
jgi:hypothetical protein